MAPNRRGAPPQQPSTTTTNGNATDAPLNYQPYDIASGGMVTKEEVEARGKGTRENTDSYDPKQFWKSENRVFWTGVLFLTRLPCPQSIDHHPAYLMRSLQWFPIIGAVVGCWGATWLRAFSILWGPGLAAAASVLATVWICGCLHEDGLADTFDGFGGGWGRAQILRIMKDSRVGTYALVGMVVVLSMKFKCIENLLVLEQDEQRSINANAVLIAAHSICRWTSLPLIYFCNYIQDEEDAKRGLYNWFAQSQRLLTVPRLLFGTLTAMAIPILTVGLHNAILMYITVIIITLLSSYYGNLVIGGVIGDYLGATIQVAELACYMVLTAQWEKVIEEWQAFATLIIVAALPIIYCRRIIKATDC